VIEVGLPAPSFWARTTENREVSLDTYRGQYLVIYFFPKAFTPGCTAEAKRFRDNYPELRALGAEVLGISIDDHETQCRFSESMRVTFPMVGDENETISRAFGARRSILPFDKRVTFVIDPEGKIVARFHHEFQVSKHLDDVRIFLEQQRARALPPHHNGG
jgi:peroxiredoxin Q/BCP